QMVLFTLICILYPLSWRETVERGVEHGTKMAAVESDIAAGTPPAMLAERHASFLYNPEHPDNLTAYLQMLQKAGIGPFRHLRQDGLMVGSLDVIDAERIVGWAWDKKHPEAPVSVALYDGERLMTTIPANQFREDLKPAGIGGGRHAFYYPTPAELKDG